MSIMVNGTLSVQRINGVNGDFSVGKLDCAIGMLNIKDPHLDQFETGTYVGQFGIVKVYSHGFAARTGCFIVETRAILDEYIIHSDDPGLLDSAVALSEADPLESSSAPPSVSSSETTPVSTQEEATTESGESIIDLFGELWPLGQSVKLDPTTMRSEPERHRARCKYLKEQGYIFKASIQTWELKQG